MAPCPMLNEEKSATDLAISSVIAERIWRSDRIDLQIELMCLSVIMTILILWSVVHLTPSNLKLQ